LRLVRATDEPARFGASAALLLARLPPRRRVRANEGGAVKPSTMCHRGDHRLCKTSGARCACECHAKPKRQAKPKRVKPRRVLRRQPVGLQPLRRVCPVCGKNPGGGFNTYCSTAHLIEGAS